MCGFFMLNKLGFENRGGPEKQQETSYPWIGVNIDSTDVDFSVFLKDDGSINGDAMFAVVKEDLLMRHKSELKWLRGFNCIYTHESK